MLALFVLGWDIRQCRQFFRRLAHQAFRPRTVTHIPRLATIHQWILAWLNDGLYPAAGIDQALSRCFGADTAIDDGRLSGSVHGTGVAVTVVTDPSAERYLITNYNGVGRRPESCGTP